MNTVSITCFQQGCGYSPFPMEEGFYHRAKRTHETWHCPAGHAQHFVGKTKEQRRIEELEGTISRLREQLEWTEKDRRRLRVTCQWIECGFVAKNYTGLRTHMRAIHGMPTLAVVREAS